MNFGLTSEQLDKIKEISERYKQLFIREYKMIRTDDEPICHEQIRELIRFVSAGTETVIQQYLFNIERLRGYIPEVTIDVCAKLNEINFNVRLCGLHRNVGQTINVLTEIANKCTGGE